MPKRSPQSPHNIHVQKKYKYQHPRHSLHDELLNDTRSSDDERSDDNLPPSAYLHKGKDPKRRVVYGLLDDDDEEEDGFQEHASKSPRKLNFSDFDDSLDDLNTSPQPSTSKSVYANAIPTQDPDDDIFSGTTNKRPVKGKSKRTSSPEPDFMMYSFRGAKCAFTNPFKNLPSAVKQRAHLPESHIDFSPLPNPKPRLLFADAHHASQLEALQREEEESAKVSMHAKDELEDYQLDSVDCVDTGSLSGCSSSGVEESKKRSACSQQPPVTPRPNKLMHPSHTDLLASAKKSNNRVHCEVYPKKRLRHQRANRQNVATTVTAILSTLVQATFSNSLVDLGNLGVSPGNSSGGNLEPPGTTRISALADLNGDQFIDLISIDSSNNSISTYIWDHSAKSFKISSTATSPFPLDSLIPTDIDGDGLIDLIAVGSPDDNQIKMSLYPGHGDGFDTHSPLPSIRYTQPTFLDAYGDLSPDYIGYAYADDANTDTGTLSLFRNHNGSLSSSPLNFDGQPCKLTQKHSNAFIDLDGDCLADVFLLCDESTDKDNKDTAFQIWRNNPSNNTFTLHSHTPLPPNSGLVTFADFNRDGTLDMVFPSCASVDGNGVGRECHINVWFNKQMPLCVDSRSFDALLHPSLFSKNGDHTRCRNPSDLCVADEKFVLDSTNALSVSVDELTKGNATLRMEWLSEANAHSQPLLLRLGDYNLDSFPDILALLHYDDGSDRGAILENTAVSDGQVTEAGGRTIELRDGSKYAALHNITDARVVSWLDIDDDGTLDVMVQRQHGLTFIQNNMPNDAFFLKTLLLNGVCDTYCQDVRLYDDTHGGDGEGEGDTALYKPFKPFGAALLGGSYKLTILDTAGRRHAAQFAQVPSTASDALYTPYSFTGVGRTNNYIENLHVGSTFKDTSQTLDNSHKVNFEGIIPNAQVVITPKTNEHSWHIEMYLKKNKWVPFVAIVVSTLCLILGAVVFALHVHEKKEDQVERRKESHHINFQAL
ncbi:hypothetical protein E3P81_04076 [Wallemia ichthyophaga]|nr:hypothetical protein E3P97_04085 [Wallemia ichthyophaga]TIB27775.1 hypothetical protein E3P85_04073 [Wallemia ichthyophaga]TIB43095.1 hypothetical protein E3P82_04084 [Wallemia ichthyophaga]TIB45321.1 hypothetical protein E3P81_04076 [Wallemia ichthyophaga]TIB47124.1 hypothetical protein E3P80_04088 [Wallemia ichthyophaga]